MRRQHPVAVDINDADPTEAINCFLHSMNRQRALGLCPRTEHTLAEHLFRGDAKIVFYSSASGIISLVQDDESIDDEDAFEVIELIMERRKKHARERREREAAIAIEARSDATGTGAAVGESAGRQASPTQSTQEPTNGK